MKEPSGTKQNLIEEISALKKKIRKLEQAQVKCRGTEELLQEERKSFLDMVNAQPVGIYRTRVFAKDKWQKNAWHVPEAAPYTVELVSNRFCEILGISRSVFEKNPGLVESMVHEEDKESFARENIEANNKLIPFQWEGRLCVEDKIVWAHFESLPRPLANGDVLWTGFLHDMTDRKRAEEALKKSAEKLRKEMRFNNLLLDNSPAFIVAIGFDGKTLIMNRSLLNSLEYTAEEIKNTDYLTTFVPEEDRAELAPVFDKIEKGSTVVNENRIVSKSGKTYLVEWHGAAVTTNEQEGGFFIGIGNDITERKQAENALRRSEDKYRTLIDTTDTGFVIIDNDGIVQDANAEYVRLSGHREIGDIIGKKVIEWTVDSDKEKNNAAVRECFTKGYVRNLEINYVDAKGKLTPIEINATCLEIEGKKQTITLCRDITKRKRAEEALRKSENKYKLVTEKMTDVVWLMDMNLQTTYVSPSIMKVLGFTQEVRLNQTVNEQLTPDSLSLVGNLLAEQLAIEAKGGVDPQRSLSCVVEYYHKDGSTRWLENNITGIRDEHGALTGLHGVSRDVTDRQQAEEALRESQERLSGFMNAATDSLYLLDSKLHFLEINENGLKIIGKKREEVIGRDIREIVPDVVESGRYDEHLKVIRTGEPFIIENHVPHPIFGNLYFILKSFKVVDGIGVIASDITELKRAEEEKHRLEERLQRAEKMEALGTLAGGVAHDLNNVLGVIVGYAELLLNESAKSSPIRPRLEKIMNGSEKAAAIVQDLLTLARRGVPVKQVVNLNKIILDNQKSLESEKLYSYHLGVRMKFDLDADLLNISGSSVHLGKALFNLVSNAVEAMPCGGEVIIRTANQYLDKPISGYDEVREGDYVVLSVSDTGQGIPAADLPRIFEPFYTKKVMGRSGTGLGLAVIWGTVKDHHGYINVQSEEGKGSTFTLYFPVTREEVTSETSAVPVSEYTGKGESVLVVDDVREQRELASEMLSKLNYKVVSSASGEDAVAYLQEHKVDLLVLDMIMYPGMDGLDTYKEILKIYPQQKAIIVSGFSETARVNAAQSLGCGAYVKKPYILEKLGLAVRKELDRK